MTIVNILNNLKSLLLCRVPLCQGKMRDYDVSFSVYKVTEEEYVVYVTGDGVLNFNLRDFPMSPADSNLRFHVICDGTFDRVNERAFFDWRPLRSVALPSSVTVIDKRAFGECHNLRFLVIPRHIRVEAEAFWWGPAPHKIFYDNYPVNEATKEHDRSRHIPTTSCDKKDSWASQELTQLYARFAETLESWDSEEWARRYQELNGSQDEQDRDVLRNMRKVVFRHTVRLVQNGGYTSPAGTEIRFPDPDAMQQNTQLYDEPLPFHSLLFPDQTEPVKIYVENRDCLVSAEEWQKKGYRVAVLNMANRQNPGGGVYNGAGAQEENLFRRTNLFQSLYMYASYGWQYNVAENCWGYPLDRNYGGVYSPNVTVFRGTEQDGYPLLEQPFSTSVISVAGMNRPELTPDGLIAPELVRGIQNKIQTIFNIGLDHHHDCLILGALGCGAFRNPPRHVARLFHEILVQKYYYIFRVIVFAILEDHNSMLRHNAEGNYLPFYEEFTTPNAD